MDFFWKKFFSQPSLLLLMPFVLVAMSRDAIAAQLTLTWSDTSNNELGFRIERRINATGGTYTEIITVPTNSTTFIDSTAVGGTAYCYRVRAYNAAGNSAYSNASCGTAPINSYTLTVTKTGTGSGTVSSLPGGISCGSGGSDCSETYTGSTPVTLTATSAPGSHFTSWSGGCSGTVPSCTLLINTSTNVTATFATSTSTNYTLTVTKVGSGTVTSSPGGITCGSGCSQTSAAYAAGTLVSLTVNPATGYQFSGWSGACTGTGACSVTLNPNKNVTATFTSTAPLAGLVAAYSFGAGSGTTVKDSSGLSNTGTLSGATWTTSGKFGNALSFNGTNARVTIPDTASLDLTTGMTLEAWVYPTALNGGTTNGWRTVILKEAGNTASYDLYANQGTNRPSSYLTIGGTDRGVVGLSQLPLNTWTHLAATYDGIQQRLFVNGTQVAQRAQTGSALISSGPLRIGGNSVWGEYFQGRIDNVRIYNRALTAAQIQANMNIAIAP